MSPENEKKPMLRDEKKLRTKIRNQKTIMDSMMNKPIIKTEIKEQLVITEPPQIRMDKPLTDQRRMCLHTLRTS